MGTMGQGTAYPDDINLKVFVDSTDAKLTRLGAGSGGIDSSYVNDVRKLATEAILGRHYDQIVTVTTTIKAAVEAVTDASSSKRYLICVPNGTYAEDSLYVKQYMDVVGESRTGVIVTSTSGTNDIFNAGGVNCLIGNMTITHTRNIGDPGIVKYPIHLDASTASGTFTAQKNSTTILYNLDVNANGTASKSAVGIGLRSAQRVYIVDCDLYSQAIDGIYIHNTLANTASCALYVVNTRSEGVYGLDIQNEGSTSNSDIVSVIGSELVGSTADVHSFNGTGGTGEMYMFIDTSTIYQTYTLIDSSKLIPYPVFTAPKSSAPMYAENEGRTYLDSSTKFNLYELDLETTTGRVGIGTTANVNGKLQVETTTQDISVFARNYKVGVGTAAGYFQNSLGTGMRACIQYKYLTARQRHTITMDCTRQPLLIIFQGT